jgi:para-aminobenzoate synthetase component 1
VLELWEPEGALEQLERWLADELRDGLAADVFLGYRLAETMRRGSAPAPPEPCSLPAAAATLRREAAPPGPYRLGEWASTQSADEHAAAVEEVRAAIARGDVYQVNLVRHLQAPFAGDPAGLQAALRHLRPLHARPFLGDGYAIVSASPELFLARRGDRLWTMPIKGTVCRTGSIRWPELQAQRELAGVTHLVSTVEGRLRPGVGLAEILAATFPGGSITGAPKIAAIDEIARLEPVGRGAAMGALGTVHANGDFELALTIRTFAVAGGLAHLWVGGGIVWDSDADAEWEETLVKARPLLAAVGAPVPA